MRNRMVADLGCSSGPFKLAAEAHRLFVCSPPQSTHQDTRMRYRLWPRCSNQVAELLLLHAGDIVPFQRIEGMPEAPPTR